MSDIPEEAISVLAVRLDEDPNLCEWALEGALPYIRATWEKEDRDIRWGDIRWGLSLREARKEWEKELLSPESLERVWFAIGRYEGSEDTAEQVIRAALGEDGT